MVSLDYLEGLGTRTSRCPKGCDFTEPHRAIARHLAEAVCRVLRRATVEVATCPVCRKYYKQDLSKFKGELVVEIPTFTWNDISYTDTAIPAEHLLRVPRDTAKKVRDGKQGRQQGGSGRDPRLQDMSGRLVAKTP